MPTTQADIWAETSPLPLLGEPAPTQGPARNLVELQGLIVHARRAPMCSLVDALIALNLVGIEALGQLRVGPAHGKWGLEHTLLDAGLVTELEIEHARVHMLNTPEIDATTFEVEAQALEKIPWTVAFKHQVLPLGQDGGVLYAASATPFNRELELQLSAIADCIVSLVWAPHNQITRRLALQMPVQPHLDSAKKYGPDWRMGPAENTLQDVYTLLSEALVEMKNGGDQELVNAVNESSSVIKLVNQMVIDAYDQKASDIHIETNPGDGVSRVRFRKDGDLED